jgi:hypothetical protein
MGLRLRWRLRTFLLAVPFLLVPIVLVSERLRYADGRRAEAAAQVAYHASMETKFRTEAARSAEEARKCRERAGSAKDPAERAGWSERAAEFDWKATISRGMASIHARSILVERAGVGLR